MYIHGYGTAKNTRAAVSLIDMIYEDNINQILKEHYEIRDQYRRWLTDEDCTICKYQERIDNIEEELENYKKLQ